MIALMAKFAYLAPAVQVLLKCKNPSAMNISHPDQMSHVKRHFSQLNNVTFCDDSCILWDVDRRIQHAPAMDAYTKNKSTNQRINKSTGLLFTFLFSLFTFYGCGTIERPTKLSATGRAGEMLVIMQNNKWEGLAGEHVRDIFQQNVPMFLQPEPMFDLVQIEERNFVSMFETHRHIFFADIKPDHEKATIEITRDVWSYPQLVVRVKAPNDSVFQVVMERNQEVFIERYMDLERERLINAYNRMTNNSARNAVEQKFGIKMSIPEGYFVAVEGDRFIWLRRTGTREDLEMGVLIASFPYKDTDIDFDPATIAARRDSLTKKYIPGQFEGTYMTTYPELTSEAREINFNDRFAVETRSLWRVEGDFMGGPFVNYTVVDENTNRLFLFDGFVYAPKFDKRDYMRQVQAVIYSVKFQEEEENSRE
jgi:hypothetical protein